MTHSLTSGVAVPRWSDNNRPTNLMCRLSGAGVGVTWPSRTLKETMMGGADMEIHITIGMVLAMILSWSRNHSIFWCIVHGLFSWLYVIYVFLTEVEIERGE